MKIGIIVGSVRRERAADAVVGWVREQADRRDDAEFEVIDLREFDLPVFDSPTLPAMAEKQYESPAVTRWSRAVDGCDGFVFITPEYNHGVPGGFKNAFDSLGPEWQDKTVGFVSYGAEGGVRSVEQWRQIVANFSMHDVRQQVSLSLFGEFGDDGLQLADRRTEELGTLFDQLVAATARHAR